MLKTCKIDGCNRYGNHKGLCNVHYVDARRRGLLDTPPCIVEGCTKKSYAKSYCYNHWFNNKYFGHPLGKRKQKFCEYPNCNIHVLPSKKFCSRHKKRIDLRIKNNAPLDTPNLMKGKYNHNWNGGVADYPDHYKFKIARKKRLALVGNKCELCGSKTNKVHHKDGSKNNHESWNLIALCHECHCFWHSGRKAKTSKFIRLYGMPKKELARRLGCSEMKVQVWHQKGILRQKLGLEPITEIPRKKYKLSKWEKLYGMTLNNLSKQLHISAATVVLRHYQGRLESLLTAS